MFRPGVEDACHERCERRCELVELDEARSRPEHPDLERLIVPAPTPPSRPPRPRWRRRPERVAWSTSTTLSAPTTIVRCGSCSPKWCWRLPNTSIVTSTSDTAGVDVHLGRSDPLPAGGRGEQAGDRVPVGHRGAVLVDRPVRDAICAHDQSRPTRRVWFVETVINAARIIDPVRSVSSGSGSPVSRTSGRRSDGRRRRSVDAPRAASRRRGRTSAARASVG